MGQVRKYLEVGRFFWVKSGLGFKDRLSLYSDITRSLAHCVQSQPQIYLEWHDLF